MSSYIDVFSGGAVQPSDVSYRAVALAADVTLVWPALSETSTDVMARIMNVTPSAGALAITFPNARQVSNGQDALVRNLGAQTFTLKDSAGGTIGTVAAGEAKYLYLTDNSTAAGAWSIITFGTGSSSADAATLAGYGLLAITTTLNQAHQANVTNVSSYAIATTDRASIIVYTGGNVAVALPSAASVGSNFFAILKNGGTGTVTLTRAGADTIDGLTTFTLAPDDSAFVFSDGITAWYTVGKGQAVAFAFTQLVKSVAGAANVTLSSAECANKVMTFTGALTGNINVIVTNTVAVYYVYNNTTGAYTLTVKTAAGTGVTVTQGTRSILVCDATNVYNAQDVNTLSGVFGSGSEGAPSITFASDTSTGIYRPAASKVAATANGTDSMRWNTATSGVNAIDVFPSATGAPVYLVPYGDDANIAFQLRGLGTGYVGLGQATSTDVRLLADQPIGDSSGNELIKFVKTAAAVNEITITNQATGASPSIAATGGDTNIALALAGKGTGSVRLGQASSTGVLLVADQPIVDSSGNELIKFVKTATAVNEITITNNATGSSPIISATGDDADISVVLTPKGAGAVQLTSGTLVGTQTTQNVFNTAATTLNLGGAATTIAIGAATSTQTHTGQAFTFTGANSTTNTALTVSNTSNAAAASHAYVDVQVGGTTSTGDPQLRLTVPGGASTYLGVDNSASDAFIIGTGTAVGTTPGLIMSSSTQAITISTGLTVTAGGTTITAGNLTVTSGALTATATGAAYHQLTGAAANQALYVVNSNGAAPNGVWVEYTGAAPNDAAHDFFNGKDTGATRVRLYGNGGLGNFSANNVNLSTEIVKNSMRGYTPDELLKYEQFLETVNFGVWKYNDQTHPDWNHGPTVEGLQVALKVAGLTEEVNSLIGEFSAGKLGIYTEDLKNIALASLVASNKRLRGRVDVLEGRAPALEAARL